MKNLPLLFTALLFAHAPAFSEDKIKEKQPVSPGIELRRDVEYGKGGERTLHLHLGMPKGEIKEALPAVVFIHGGGWKGGSRDGGIGSIYALAKNGYVGASIEYRFSQVAKFPAQIEDCKCAIRFLREHAAEYHIDPDRIGVWGASAGGHLVALLGTTADVKELEGSGGSEKFSSKVQAVCDWFGPTDFTTISKSPGAVSPVSELIGGVISENADKAKRASPMTYVNKDAAPILIMHGDQDQLVPVDQSETFAKALKEAGVDVTLRIIKGAGHGGPGFNTEEVRRDVLEFFNKHLKAAPKPD